MTHGSLYRNLFSTGSTGVYLYGDRIDLDSCKSNFDLWPLPTDGTIFNASAKASLHFRPDWTADLFVQHERWLTILWTPNRHL